MLIPFRKPKTDSGPIDLIIAGLGNPGRKYENTRHNIGFMVLNEIAARNHVKLNKIKYKSLCGQATIDDKRVLLLKPQTFMNLSGQAVREAASFYKIPPENTVIIFDDISLDPGQIRIRRKGSDGGHNGMKNIIYLSGADTYPRIKVGVGGKPHSDSILADWVLSTFRKDEMALIQQAVSNAADAALLIADNRFDEAMNQYNAKSR